MGFSHTEPRVGQLITWTDGMVGELLRINALGWSSAQMAEHLGVPGKRNVVIGKLSRLGLKINPNRPAEQCVQTMWTEALDAELVRLRAMGCTRQEIAEKMKISARAVESRVGKLLKNRVIAPIGAGGSVLQKFRMKMALPLKPYFEAEKATTEGKTFADLGPKDCRYTIGKKKFCAKTVLEGKSWCEGCFLLVYRRAA